MINPSWEQVFISIPCLSLSQWGQYFYPAPLEQQLLSPFKKNKLTMDFEKYLSVNLAKSSCCCLSNSSSGIPRFSNLVLCLRRFAAISLCSPNT